MNILSIPQNLRPPRLLHSLLPILKAQVWLMNQISDSNLCISQLVLPLGRIAKLKKFEINQEVKYGQIYIVLNGRFTMYNDKKVRTIYLVT